MLTDFEKYLLAQAIPALALPGLRDPSDVDLWGRADLIGYGDPDFYKRGEGNLVELMKILAVLPSSYKERMAAVGG